MEIKATTPELKKLIGKVIEFNYKNRSYTHIGIIEEVFRRQVYICGDWFSISGMYNINLI